VQKKILPYLPKHSLAHNFFDLLFPPHCLVCGKHLSYGNVCKECLQHINFLEFPLIEHSGKFYFYAVTKYEGVSSALVKSLKFGKKKSVSMDIGNIISIFIKENNIEAPYISYVPMSVCEQKKRGFNQSYLIARAVSEITGLELYNDIKKVRDTKKQVGLSRYERKINIKNAFKANRKVKGSMIIIDDVYTTGSTAKEVSTAVKNLVDANVFFIAFSRKID
jgi:competence protein ComFC